MKISAIVLTTTQRTDIQTTSMSDSVMNDHLDEDLKYYHGLTIKDHKGRGSYWLLLDPLPRVFWYEDPSMFAFIDICQASDMSYNKYSILRNT